MQTATMTAPGFVEREPVHRPIRSHTEIESASMERAEILTVLVRAALDPEFIAELTYHPCEALGCYKLGRAARQALESGDVHWIELHVGQLDPIERTWLDCRLQQEIW